MALAWTNTALPIPEGQLQQSEHLVVVVVERAAQQNEDAGPQVLHKRAKLGQGGDGGRAHGRVLQDDAVVDVADVLGGLARLGALHAQQVQDLGGQVGELAVLHAQ